MTYTDKALLLAEFSCPLGVCPVCRGSGTHQMDCVMDLAISERGYCTGEERNHARTFIESQFSPTMPPPTKP